MKYEIYTDGACSVKKRFGGYAAIAKFDGQQIVVHGNKKNATNNEMELLAVINILRVVNRFVKRGDTIIVSSDSAYVVNAINDKWLDKWIRSGWETKENKPVKNRELWSEMTYILSNYLDMNIAIMFVKVKGHSDCKLNNYVDRLAVKETQILKEKQLED